MVLEHTALPIHEHGCRDCLVQTRCRDGREQPRQSRLAAQRHLARRQLGGNRVFRQVEGAQLWISERVCAGHHTAFLDAGQRDPDGARDIGPMGECGWDGPVNLV